MPSNHTETMSATENLKSFLCSVHRVKDEILDEYVGCWEKQSYRKKSTITAAGQVQRDMLFVVNGIQKSYHLTESGKEHVIAFTYPPSLSGIPESFLSQAPSRYYIDTITESEFLCISFQKHQEMMQKHREIETLFRRATEILLTGVMDRHYELMAHDIETRFRILLERSPHLLNMVPRKDLASYLRINVANFSTLLSKVHI